MFAASHSVDFPLREAKRRLLQRLQGHETALRLLQLLTAAIVGAHQLTFAFTQALQFIRDLA